jgi:tyrosyl-tRNA synthetase
MALAREIVAIFHGDEAARAAEAHFTAVFQKGALPDDMETLAVDDAPLVVEFLARHKLAASKSEARRLVEQGGVRVNGRAIADLSARLEFDDQAILQVGKRRFARLIRGQT